jgi:hypothetical protein
MGLPGPKPRRQVNYIFHPLSHRLFQTYKSFSGKDWPLPTSPDTSGGRLAFLSGLADPHLSILIRALLDRRPAAQSSLFPDHPGPSAGPTAYMLAQDRLERIRGEVTEKFLDFRERWRKRLAFTQLLPFLQRNQWIVPSGEGFVLTGKGTRKDSKMLYLQSLHDMASDAERQVSLISGHVFRLQGEAAAAWHQESVRDDFSRLLPALEVALRPGEENLFKKLRLSLGDLAEGAFTERVGRWEKRVHASEEALFKDMAWPWYHARYRSGFEGFMESFADLAESLCGAMLDHYEAKWNLFSRGLAPSAVAEPTGPAGSEPDALAAP